MAHGFLTPTAVTGEGLGIPGIPYKKLYDGIKSLFRKDLRVVNANVKEVRDLIEGKNQAKLPPAATKILGGSSVKGLLGPASGGLANRGASGLVEKNPTDIDLKTGKKLLTPGGPRLQGGGVTSAAATPLNPDTFLNRAQTGVGSDGEYLTKAQRIADFKAGRQPRQTDGPSITPDSGVDIVAAVNRNTEAIVALSNLTKEQTKEQRSMHNEEQAQSDKLANRALARAEEKELEKGNDLSNFLKAERFKKKEKSQGGGGGDDGLFDFLDLGLDVLDLMGGGKRKRRGGRSGRRPGGSGRRPGANRRPPRIQVPKPKPRGAAPIPRTKPPAPKGGFKFPGIPEGGLKLPGMPKGGLKLPGMPKALKGIKGGGALSLLLAGMEFSGRKAEGQSNLQAGVGTAAGVAGGLLGAKGGAAVGAAIGALFGGFGAIPGAVIGGALGSVGGSMLASNVADMATGANNVGGFSSGGIITKPTLSMMGEGHKKEGVFPLEGKEGKKTFAMFGEGLIEAQDKAKDKFAKIQAAGLKFYFQNQDGFKFFGNILKTAFAPFLEPLKALSGLGGGILNSLLGGSANAATLGFGSNFAGNMSADEQQLTEALIAAEEGVKTEAYQDTEGIWTIGYGQTTLNGRAVRQGDKISKEEALTGFRSNVKSHAQRAINQVGEKRWQELDPKARAVLTSLAYNYGSIPEAVLPSAKSGSTEDIAKSMDALYGHNRGILKERRQREQSILRGNLQGDAGNAVRLDKDFMAGGRFAGAGSGPMIAGGPGAPGPGGRVVEYLTGDKTSSGYRADHGGGNYHDHIAFDSKETRDSAAEWLKKKGWKIGSMNDGRHADGSYHYSDQAFDIPFYPNQRIKGVTDDSTGETKLSSALRKDLAEGGFTGSGIAPVPGANPPANPQQPLTAVQKAKMFQSAGMPALSANTLTGAIPGPVPASPAPGTANSGTPIMATSAQVASASAIPTATPTIINNYYGGGGNQPTGVNPNGVSAGIDMDAAGLSAFQDLKIRSLS